MALSTSVILVINTTTTTEEEHISFISDTLWGFTNILPDGTKLEVQEIIGTTTDNIPISDF